MNEWQMAQEFERSWWGNCINTYCEEVKQLTYAFKMGLIATREGERWPVYNLGGRRILDIGGGPVSMLLKSSSYGPATTVLDPCKYPSWVRERYQAAGIALWEMRGEDLPANAWFDEVWIYNCLQHTEDPELVISNARKVAPHIRIFEWLNTPAWEGHPQTLDEDDLNAWLSAKGTVEGINENGCAGLAYHGVFQT